MTLQQIVKVSILSSALFVIGCSSQTTEPTVTQVKAPTTMTPEFSTLDQRKRLA